MKKPTPDYTTREQQGITDPRYALETPDGVDDVSYEPYRGRIEPQAHMALLRLNVRAHRRDVLRALLEELTLFARRNEERTPSTRHIRPLEDLPNTYRVTITIGFGSTLFVDCNGHDRFGISGLKPRNLKVMPRFDNDSLAFEPSNSASDLALLFQSDSTYVNVALSRWIIERFNPDFAEKHGVTDVLQVTGLEVGFGRPDKREFLRFDDGIDNLRPGEGEEMERLVYVDETNQEPRWCHRGSYMVYRKIRENLPVWEQDLRDANPHTPLADVQSAMIGRDKETGCPFSREKTGPEGLTPVYPDATDARDGRLDSHVRKVQPRRLAPDLFGIVDLNRRFLRRPYPFFDGIDSHGAAISGLHFLAFTHSIQDTFEHIVNMWQLNPDFPVVGAGIDALYASGVLETLDGGYYFCPPEPRSVDGFLGEGLFDG